MVKSMKKFGNYCVSSTSTIDDFMDTLTEETGGNCLGPADYEGIFTKRENRRS